MGTAAPTRTFSVFLVAALVGVSTVYVTSPQPTLALATVVVASSVALVILTQLGVSALVVSTLALSAFLTPMNAFRLTNFMNVSDAFLLVAALIVIVRDLAAPTRSRYPDFIPVFTSLIIVVFGGLLATVLSQRYVQGAPGLIRFAVSTLAIVALIAMWAPGRREVRTVVWAYVAGAALSAAVALVAGTTLYAGRAVGLANHPNHLGMVSMFACGGAIGLAMTSRAAVRLVALSFSAMLVLGIVISGSRGALLGSAVTFIVVTVSMRNWRVLRLAAVVGIFMVLGGAFGVLHLPNDNAVDRLLNEDPRTQASNIERRAAVAESVAQIRAHPITGAGFEYAQSAHSIYLQMWAAAGVIGLFGFFRLYHSVIRLLLRYPSTDPLRTVMLATFVGYLTAGVVLNILWDRYVWLFLGLSLGLFFSSHRPTAENAAAHATSSESPISSSSPGSATPGFFAP
jgi:O-antigen ligase